MKKHLLFLLLSLSASAGFSQVKWGVNAGAGLTNTLIRYSFAPNEFQFASGDQQSFQLGLDVCIAFDEKLSFNHEFRYYRYGLKGIKGYYDLGLGGLFRYSLNNTMGIESGLSIEYNHRSMFNESKINLVPSLGASAFIQENLKLNLRFDYSLRPVLAIHYGSAPINPYDPLRSNTDEQWQKFHNQRIMLSVTYFFEKE